ncbi:transposase [Streptomyces sp. NPDC001156]
MRFQRKYCQVGSTSSRSRRYTEEFKRDAVALVCSSGKTVTEVAREIGVSAEGLRNWVKQGLRRSSEALADRRVRPCRGTARSAVRAGGPRERKRG